MKEIFTAINSSLKYSPTFFICSLITKYLYNFQNFLMNFFDEPFTLMPCNLNLKQSRSGCKFWQSQKYFFDNLSSSLHTHGARVSWGCKIQYSEWILLSCFIRRISFYSVCNSFFDAWSSFSKSRSHPLTSSER